MKKLELYPYTMEIIKNNTLFESLERNNSKASAIIHESSHNYLSIKGKILKANINSSPSPSERYPKTNWVPALVASCSFSTPAEKYEKIFTIKGIFISAKARAIWKIIAIRILL